MSNNAKDYADTLIAQINFMTDSGAPFGLINYETEEWSNVVEDFEDYLNNEDTEWSAASGMDYLSDALDIHYVLSSDKQYRAGRVCITLGGPTAWLNTYTKELEVTWWSAPETRVLPLDFINGLDDTLEELYNC